MCTFSLILKDIAFTLSKFQAIFRHDHFFGFTLLSYLNAVAVIKPWSLEDVS